MSGGYWKRYVKIKSFFFPKSLFMKTISTACLCFNSKSSKNMFLTCFRDFGVYFMCLWIHNGKLRANKQFYHPVTDNTRNRHRQTYCSYRRKFINFWIKIVCLLFAIFSTCAQKHILNHITKCFGTRISAVMNSHYAL